MTQPAWTPFSQSPRGPRHRRHPGLLRMLTAGLCLATPVGAATITVTGTGDTVAVDGVVTLREAIDSLNGGANVNADVVAVGAYGTDDRIHFAIPGAGVQTIQPASALPDLEVPMTIDGYTQPGASVNTQVLSDDAVLLIELDGTLTGGAVGLTVATTAGGTTIRGLVVNRFGHAILLNVADDCVIAGNFLGTDASGTIDLGNTGNGVWVFFGGRNTIGGPDPADRNLLSGNLAGVDVQGASDTTVIQGNFVGTDATGTVAIPNFTGVRVFGSSGDQVGGKAPGEGNVISGNTFAGVALLGSSFVSVEGNLIGTDATGSAPLPNSGDGVLIGATIVGPSSANTIGASSAQGGNVIAFNLGNGINVQTPPMSAFEHFANTFLANSIFDNLLLGIDLGGDGVTPNDPCDTDTGHNSLQNYPELTAVVSSGGTTTITGTLDSTPNVLFSLAFFSSPACDPSGFGEGRTFLGFEPVMTDGSCIGTIDVTLPVAVAPGDVVTAIARPSDPTTDTSEFSACLGLGAAIDMSEIPVLSGLGLAVLCVLLAAAALALLSSTKLFS